MNLERLRRAMQSPREFCALHGRARMGGEIWDAMGLMREEERVRMVLISYSIAWEEEEEQWRTLRAPTRRARIAANAEMDRPDMLTEVCAVRLNECEYSVGNSESTMLSKADLLDQVGVAEFLRAGYVPHPEIARCDFSTLRLTVLTFEGDFDVLPDPERGPVVLLTRRGWEYRPMRKRLNLEVNRPLAHPYKLTDRRSNEKHIFYITDVRLIDPWELMGGTAERRPQSAVRVLESLCPRGMRLPVVEYESEPNIVLEFFTPSYLDTPLSISKNQDGPTGLIVKPNGPKLGEHGLQLRAALVRTSVPPGATDIELEMLRYQRALPEMRIMLRSNV